MEKHIKNIKEIAMHCAKIAIENKFPNSAFTQCKNDQLRIIIYCADSHKTISVSFTMEKTNKTIDCTLYANKITFPMDITLVDLINLEILCESFVYIENMNVHELDFVQQIKENRIKEIKFLENQLETLKNELKS